MESQFHEIIIDALDDPHNRLGKEAIFKELLERNGWLTSEVCVIGDNPNSEAAVAKALGVVTVQTVRPDIKMVRGFDHYVSSFSELRSCLPGLFD